jgi:hypothetical protein
MNKRILPGQEHFENARRLLSRIEFELMDPSPDQNLTTMSNALTGLDICFQNIGVVIVQELGTCSGEPSNLSEL